MSENSSNSTIPPSQTSELELDKKIQTLLVQHELTKKRNKVILFTLFMFAFGLFLILLLKMPPVTPTERKILFAFPDTPEHFSATKAIIRKYANQNFFYVLTLFIYLYVLMQSFAIPGPVFLSIISGSLWNFYFSLAVTSLCATFGASVCYLLSQSFFKGWILKIWPKSSVNFMRKVSEHRHNIFFYMISLRFSPLFPNIMVNLTSPIAGVPLHVFFISTFIGLIPLNFIHVNTGATIDDINNVGLKPKHFLILLTLAGVAVLPTIIFRKNNKQKND